MPLIAAHKLNIDDSSTQIYNGMDCCLTYEINDALYKLGHNDHLIYDFERALQAPALEMMQRGFKVDSNAQQIAVGNTHRKLDACEKILQQLSRAVWDRDVNPNSGKQLKELFYDTMRLPPIKQWSKGVTKIPMDRKTLEKLEAYFYARPIVNAVLLHRDLTKTLQVLETEIDSDWRWRTSYNIAGTTTGRWSSSKSPTGTGGNAQNVTDELRRIFIPDEGYKLAGLDLEQAEAREVGWFCGTILGDWSYLDMIEAGDPHTYVARMCWPELPWNGDIRKDRKIAERKFYRHFTYRDATKRLSHGSNYLGLPPTMAGHTKIPLAIVQRFQQRYFESFPCIPRMHQWVAREIQTTGFLVTSFGRRRDFFDRTNADETIRGAVAYLFQSATGDRLNLALWRIWKHMGTRVQLLAQLHDAVYFQYRIDDNERDVIEQAQKLMLVNMSHKLPNGNIRNYTIPSDAQVGFNWAHRYRLREDGTPEDWNPKGLDKYRYEITKQDVLT